jgi:hypothetical protein
MRASVRPPGPAPMMTMRGVLSLLIKTSRDRYQCCKKRQREWRREEERIRSSLRRREKDLSFLPPSMN